MTYTAHDDDGWDEHPDAGDDDTVPCPYCRRPIHEDAQRCPYCEQYISEEDAPGGRKPWWILLAVAVCLAVVLSWLVPQ